jgi:hypothetical protein
MTDSKELTVVQQTPPSWSIWFKDTFNETLERSKVIRSDLWQMKESATIALKDILDDPSDDSKVLALKLQAAKYILDANTIPMPKIGDESTRDTVILKEYQSEKKVSHQELVEISRIAIEEERERMKCIEAEYTEETNAATANAQVPTR